MTKRWRRIPPPLLDLLRPGTNDSEKVGADVLVENRPLLAGQVQALDVQGLSCRPRSNTPFNARAGFRGGISLVMAAASVPAGIGVHVFRGWNAAEFEGFADVLSDGLLDFVEFFLRG